MMNDDQKTEIKVQGFNWKQKMLITGHYEFEITNKNLSKGTEKTIFRRFSDIEWLHEGLVKYNPGCRIPTLPEKNMWANLNVNNSLILEKRKKLIEEYLNYINEHRHLKLNPNFLIFLSDDFELKKNDNAPKANFYEKFTNMTAMIPGMFKSQKTNGLCAIEDDDKLEKERENLVRLLKAMKDLTSNLKDFIKTNKEKVEAIKNILDSTKSIQSYSLDFNSDNESSSSNKLEKSISKNLEVINEFFEKNINFSNEVESSTCDQLEKYESELKGLIEIFDRKESERNKLLTLQKEERTDEKNKEILLQKDLLDDLNKQLIDEIGNFKLNRENDLLLMIKKFFKVKAECCSEIEGIFTTNLSFTSK